MEILWWKGGRRIPREERERERERDRQRERERERERERLQEKLGRNSNSFRIDARAEPSTEDGVLIASTIDNLHGNGLTNFSLCHSSLSIAVEYRRRVGGNNFLRTLHLPGLLRLSLGHRCITAVATRTNCNLTVAKKGLRPKESSEGRGEERTKERKPVLGSSCLPPLPPPPPLLEEFYRET